MFSPLNPITIIAIIISVAKEIARNVARQKIYQLIVKIYAQRAFSRDLFFDKILKLKI